VNGRTVRGAAFVCPRPLAGMERRVPSKQPRHAAIILARAGLAARTAFYVLLLYLIVRVAVASHDSRPANTHGALSIVAAGGIGIALLVAASAGFAALGVVRLWSAIRDTAADRWPRVRAVLEGIFYLILAWIPTSFALGNHSTGSEHQQQQTTADLLHLPGGRVIVCGIGIGIVIVAAYQIWSGVDEKYVDRLAIDDAPRWVQAVARASGKVGLPARALVFLPIGVFFILAAFGGDASRADGIDHELTSLTGNPWGDIVLGLIALGLLVFVVYSALEVRYRDITAS